MFPFKTALNASTLFPFKLDVKQQVQIAAEAGFEGIELWVKDIADYLDGGRGGTIPELKAYIASRGIRSPMRLPSFPGQMLMSMSVSRDWRRRSERCACWSIWAARLSPRLHQAMWKRSRSKHGRPFCPAGGAGAPAWD